MSVKGVNGNDEIGFFKDYVKRNGTESNEERLQRVLAISVMGGNDCYKSVASKGDIRLNSRSSSISFSPMTPMRENTNKGQKTTK